MLDFKKMFLDNLPGSISRFSDKVITFAQWLDVAFKKVVDLHTTIVNFRDLKNANGKALDNIGAQFNQQRGGADDDFYRTMILSKQATNSGNTTINGLINMIARSLSIEKNKIRVEPLRKYVNGVLNNGEPLAIRISNIPLEWAKSDFQQNYIIERINGSIAAGVRVVEVSFIDSANATLTIKGFNSATMTYEINEGAN